MSVPRRRAGVLTFLIGAFAGIGGAALFGPRLGAFSDKYGALTGRGQPGTPPSTGARAAGHEPQDASARNLFRIMAVFAVSALASVGLMAFGLQFLHRGDHARELGLTRIERTVIQPPEPRLQADPTGDLAHLRAYEYEKLHTLARLSPATARIPIERAMALTIGQPLDRADTQGDGK